MLSLNPCSNGICSKSNIMFNRLKLLNVLILVLMEYALRAYGRMKVAPFVNSLNPCSNGICSKSSPGLYLKEMPSSEVLILVLMEYALRAFRRQRFCSIRWRLNPCSNGICSKSKEIRVHDENGEPAS